MAYYIYYVNYVDDPITVHITHLSSRTLNNPHTV